MRILLIPAFALAIALATVAPVSAGGKHQTGSQYPGGSAAAPAAAAPVKKTQSKVCHPTKTHHCKPAKHKKA